MLRQIHSKSPEREDRQSLVRPAEPTPELLEASLVVHLPHQQRKHKGEKWNADVEALADGLLVELQEIGNDEARAAQGRIAAGNRRRHHAQQREDAAEYAEPFPADQIDDRRRITDGLGTARNQLEGRFGFTIEEIAGYRRPDERHGAFRNHGPVENRTPHLLMLDTTGHQRALRGMKAADRSAGNRDEQARENRVLGQGTARRVFQPFPNLRNIRELDKQDDHQGNRHEDQSKGEHRIYPADDLVDRQQRGNDVIDKDDDDPETVLADGIHHKCRFPDAAQDLGRAEHEHGTYHHQQEDREDQHHRLRGLAEIGSDEFRQVGAAMPDRQHARQIVVYGTREDTAEHNPEIGRRAELGAHDRTENRTRPGNIQELDHENLPRGQHDIVYPIGFGDSRRGPVVGPEHTFNESTVKKIAGHQGRQGKDKRNHRRRILLQK